MATATKEKHPAKPARKTKISSVIDLLGRDEGASLDDISKATGWQKHTVRASFTGLKKKGHEINRVQVEGVSRYTISKMPSKG